MLPSKPPPPRKASLRFQPLVGSRTSKRSAESLNFTCTTQYSGELPDAATTAASVTRAEPWPRDLSVSVRHLFCSATAGGMPPALRAEARLALSGLPPSPPQAAIARLKVATPTGASRRAGLVGMVVSSVEAGDRHPAALA